MKLGIRIILWLGIFTAVGLAAQTGNATQPVPSDTSKVIQTSHIKKDLTQQSRPRAGDESDSRYIKGKVRFLSLRRPLPVTGASGAASAVDAGGAHGMPFWQGQFEYLGATFPFRMIGTDPAQGSATTTIPVALIPLQLTYPDGTQLSAVQNGCGDTQSPVARILGSPLFNDFSYTVGTTFVGKTQYMDAFQRANFWKRVSEKSPGYHVLLSPKQGALSPITPEGLAQDGQGPCMSTGAVNNGKIATVDIGVLDQQIQNLIVTLGIPGNTLPVFVMYDVFATENGQCCILGYHNETFTNQTYAVASYDDPGIFTLPIEDIHPLSHELGEWMDDPFIRNFIPAWGNVGQEGGCSFSLEVGDPVTGKAFEVTMNGFTYHPEDLVFWTWFSRQQPSSSVNGQYTFLNSLTKTQFVCQP